MVISHGIYGKIPAFQILLQAGRKLYLCGVAAILIFSVYTIGGYLKPLPSHHHRHRSMLNPGIDTAGKQSLHLLRPGGGGNVPILRLTPQNGIPYTPPHRIRLKAGSFNSVNNLFRSFRYFNMNIFLHGFLSLPLLTASRISPAPPLRSAFLRAISCVAARQKQTFDKYRKGGENIPPPCVHNHYWAPPSFDPSVFPSVPSWESCCSWSDSS